MKDVISKEVLGEVLAVKSRFKSDILNIKIDGNFLFYKLDRKVNPTKRINIDELARKCREVMWHKYGFEYYPIRIKNEKNYGKFAVRVLHKHSSNKDREAFYYFDNKIFSTEVEISFTVYQWIIDNI